MRFWVWWPRLPASDLDNWCVVPVFVTTQSDGSAERGICWRSRKVAEFQYVRGEDELDGKDQAQLKVVTRECEQIFQDHPEPYFQPVRLRVSHLFLAAPSETSPEIVDLKQKTIASLSERISHGENFSDLVGSTSEDEATKTRGGDLGFFAAYRMPPDFFAAAAKMRPGQISQPVRTSLGFHIIQINGLEARPANDV